MDLPFLHKTKSYNPVKIHVSILVLMDLPFLQMKVKNVRQLGKDVSILVLMDLPFLLET